jgi:hypothetical protein
MSETIETLKETIANADRMAAFLPAQHRMTYIVKAREARARLAELEAAAQPVHAGTGDGRMVCNGTYGGPAVNPKYDAGRITCPDCAAALNN